MILGKNAASQTSHIEVFVYHLLKLGNKLMTYGKNNTHIEIIVKRTLALQEFKFVKKKKIKQESNA